MEHNSASTAILLLGMHRSGTSVMTRVVNLLGVELGSHFLPPAEDNPKGFWEHLGAYEIHERVLAALGRTWHDMSEMPEGWMEHPSVIQAVGEIEQLIREEFNGSPLWAVKDPRMCRLAPLWVKATKNLGIRTVAIIVVREPMEVAASLVVRDGWTRPHSYLMWTQHFLEAEASTRDLQRIIVSYEALMSDWRGSVNRAARELDISWPHSLDSVAESVGAYIDPSGLRHHTRDSEAADSAIPRPPRLASDLYRESLRIESGLSSWGQLHDGQRLYAFAADLMGRPLAEQEQLNTKLRGDVHIWEAEAKSVNRRLMVAQEDHMRSQRELGESRERADMLLRERDRLQQSLDDLRSEGKVLIESIEDLQRQHEQAIQQRDDLGHRLTELETRTRSRLWLLKRFFGYNKA